MRREEGTVKGMLNSAVRVETGYDKVRSSGSTVTDEASLASPFAGIPGWTKKKPLHFCRGFFLFARQSS
jgi:hypothetical protein